jgi:hypothetical protein
MPNRNFLPGLMALGVMALVCSCSNGGDGEESCNAGLLAGDLVITEIMADAEGPDEGKEWIELYNPTAATIDLTGVKIEAAKADGTGAEFHIIGGADILPGQYLVLGGMIEEVKPAYVDYAYGADLGGLRNDGGQIKVACGSAQVDRVIYGETNSGVSLIFDGQQTPDAIANDDAESWCDSRNEFETGSFGTPQLANEACDSELPPTSCREGDQVRDVVGPEPGDLVITEFMANPGAVGDTPGEWFEVYVGKDLDLNGLQIGKTQGEWIEQVASIECVRVTAGSYLLFAHSDLPAENGGLPQVDWVFGIGLANTGGSLVLGYGGELMDSITYSAGMVDDGVSTPLEPTLIDPTENDNESYWCAGTDAYGDGDLGSPGAVNPSCGISPEGKCYDGGTLRDQVKPGATDLVISEVMADPSAVGDGDGEWFEIYVAVDADLNHLQVGKTIGEVAFTLPGGDCITVTAGTYLVIAGSLDPELNGHLPRADAELPNNFLSNAGSELFVGMDDVVFDHITYGSASSGTATSLDLNSLDTVSNDEALNWCPATDTYGDGDRGSPGGANPECQ